MVTERRTGVSSAHPGGALFFRCESVNANTEYLPHSHEWGQVICVKSGILTLNISGQRFLAPCGFAIWIPPHMEHASHNRKPTRFRSININADCCLNMPSHPCLLDMSAIAHAIIDDCFARGLEIAENERDRRLCQVLVDQLLIAPLQHTYLPGSRDRYLAPILQALEANPSNNTPLSEWAASVYTTERTLARRSQKELGMSLSEWKQRLRFLHGVALLEQGKTVQQVAFEVGYSSASAFIATFRHISGLTPEQYRRRSAQTNGPTDNARA